MARRRKQSLRSNLYRSARMLGDLEAFQKGGVAGYAEREARKAVYREENRLLYRFLRALGLMGRR
jgi:hypothetical protein